MSPPDAVSDEELLKLILIADDEAFAAGEGIKQRHMQVPSRVMRKLGYISFVIAGSGTPALLERIYSIYNTVYKVGEFAMGGHIGVFMYKDTFARISVPHIYGTVKIEPLRHVDLTDIQKRVLQSDWKLAAAYADQFCDVFDLEYGQNQLLPKYAKSELTRRYLTLGRLQLHAAAAVLTGGYDYRGAVQSSLLATELMLKAGAASRGLDEREIKNRSGHKLPSVLDFINDCWPLLDAPRMQQVISRQPAYVENRYTQDQPQRTAVGEIVMGAQFLAGEIIRQLGEVDFRSLADPPWSRVYPPLN